LTRITDALDRVTRLGLDTAPIIYFIEQHPKYHPIVRSIFRAFSTGTVFGITSVVTLVAVLTLPLALGNHYLAQQYRDVLLHSRNLRIFDLNATIAERAADLRARYRLRTPDALQLAAALERGCAGDRPTYPGSRRPEPVGATVTLSAESPD
jgi:predicted nucleic acid-binding protein